MKEINWALELCDTLASMGGWFGRWLNANSKRVCFVVWSIVTAYWAVRDFHLGLYSQSLFCVVSIALNVYGFIKWQVRDEKIAKMKEKIVDKI